MTLVSSLNDRDDGGVIKWRGNTGGSEYRQLVGEDWSRLGKYILEVLAIYSHSNVQQKVENVSCYSDCWLLPFITFTHC